MDFRLTALAVLCSAAAGGALPLSPAQRSSSDTALQAALAVQVALDRAGFSPGEIDGRHGANTRRAVAAFRAARELGAGDSPDEAVLAALGVEGASALVEYTVSEADLAGPFAPAIPADLMQQAKLDALAYTSAWEMLGERFHASPALLQRLNPVTLAPGVVLRVPNVEPLVLPGRTGARQASPDAQPPAARIRVVARDGTLSVSDAAGRVIFHAPVTVGGAQDPLPTGQWKAIEIFDLPVFNYNPDLFWDADPSHAKARIAPGPNNPVGLVWIDLDLENYGIHGTPEPSQIGRSQSHGCVRLTNWDAVRLASMVPKHTPVAFE